MTTAEHLDSIGTLKQLTESWKSSLEKYREAMASNLLDQAREAETERRKLLSELRAVVDRLRAQHPEDASVRAAWEQFHLDRGFLLFGMAEGVTPYLEKLTHRSVAEWQPLARSTVDGINPRAVHNNWIMEGWPQRLLRARLSQAMTQKEAAHACGVAEQTYERWERGEQPPAIGNVPKVLSFIQIAPLILRTTCLRAPRLLVTLSATLFFVLPFPESSIWARKIALPRNRLSDDWSFRAAQPQRASAQIEPSLMGRSKPLPVLPPDKPSDGTSLNQIAAADLLPTSPATPPSPPAAITPLSLSMLQQFFELLDQWDRERETGPS